MFLSVANSHLFFLKGLVFPPAQVAKFRISGGHGKEASAVAGYDLDRRTVVWPSKPMCGLL